MLMGVVDGQSTQQCWKVATYEQSNIHKFDEHALESKFNCRMNEVFSNSVSGNKFFFKGAQNPLMRLEIEKLNLIVSKLSIYVYFQLK